MTIGRIVTDLDALECIKSLLREVNGITKSLKKHLFVRCFSKNRRVLFTIFSLLNPNHHFEYLRNRRSFANG